MFKYDYFLDIIMNTKGKRTLSIEIPIFHEDIDKEKKDWSSNKKAWQEVTSIFQALYNRDFAFAEEILYKYSLGTQILENLPDVE